MFSEGGAAALKACARQVPDVVVCDLYMPKPDGFEVLHALRRDYPGMWAVAMSGNLSEKFGDQLSVALRLGANAVLPKPFNSAALLTAVLRAG